MPRLREYVICSCVIALAVAFAILAPVDGLTSRVFGAVVLSATALGAVFLDWAARDRGELQRFVRGLQAHTVAPVMRFRFSSRARAVARDVSSLHDTLIRRINDLEAACQRLDVGQRAAVAAQQRAEAVLHGLPDAAIVTNCFGEITHCNHEAARLYGFDPDQVRGSSLRHAIAGTASAQLIEQIVQRALAAGQCTEDITVPRGAQTRCYRVAAYAVRDLTAKPCGTIITLHDATAERAAQSRASEFVSAVSHEIKTPLTSVKAYVELLADGDVDGDPEAQRKYLGIIESEADRMTRMLDGLLDLARIESGVIRIEKRPLSLNDLLERAAGVMRPAAADKQLTLDARLTSLYLEIVGDSDMLDRVALNLLSNAIKYTPCGGRITVRSSLQGDHAVFEVQDTGHGIPPQAMDNLFRKFYRVEENAHVATGTGLGLALVKHLVEEVHGGRIEVESKVGTGSTFRVLLPVPACIRAANASRFD